MDQPIAISIAECARLMDVTRKHVYHLINTDPTFPRPFKVGRCTRILLSELQEWLANKAKQARDLQRARQSGQPQQRETVRLARSSASSAISADPSSRRPLV